MPVVSSSLPGSCLCRSRSLGNEEERPKPVGKCVKTLQVLLSISPCRELPSTQALSQKPTPENVGMNLSCAMFSGEPNSLLWPSLVARMCQLCLQASHAPSCPFGELCSVTRSHAIQISPGRVFHAHLFPRLLNSIHGCPD